MTKEKFKHNKSVYTVTNNGWVNEYDKYGRNTYHQMPSGYWSLLFYEDPKDDEKPPVKPVKVTHKYSKYYNN